MSQLGLGAVVVRSITILVPRFIIDAYRMLTGREPPCLAIDDEHYKCVIAVEKQNGELEIKLDTAIPILLYLFTLEAMAEKNLKLLEQTFREAASILGLLRERRVEELEHVAKRVVEEVKKLEETGNVANLQHLEMNRGLRSLIKSAISRLLKRVEESETRK